MNIVDRLTGGRTDENTAEAIEHKMRHDVLFTQIRARHPQYGPENIDLSQVNLSLSDDETRAAVARELGITSEERIAEIDLDEIISPSGEHRRRARRQYIRAQERQRRKGQSRFRRQQRLRRFAEGRPSNHEVAVARRTREAQVNEARRLMMQEDLSLAEAMERVGAGSR